MGMTIDDLKQECKYCYREVDASGLEAFRCTNKTVNMETSWCRPKNANEPCSICDYCKPREEMGMTIEQIIKYLPAPICGDTVIGKEKQKEYEAHDSAVIILRKYQKLEAYMRELEKNAQYGTLRKLKIALGEVEDGNDKTGC